MSRGYPGKDFEPTEMVTAAGLIQWAEQATWLDIDQSETDGTIYGVSITETEPASSEGVLWWNPTLQLLQVYSRYGWTPFGCPFSWYTRRFRARHTQSFLGMPRTFQDRYYPPETGTATSASVTLGTAVFYRYEDGDDGNHTVAVISQETGASGAYLNLLGKGIGIVRRHPTGDPEVQNPFYFKVGFFEAVHWLVSDSTDGANPLGLLGYFVDTSLPPPDVAQCTVGYLFGGFVDAKQE